MQHSGKSGQVQFLVNHDFTFLSEPLTMERVYSKDAIERVE